MRPTKDAPSVAKNQVFPIFPGVGIGTTYFVIVPIVIDPSACTVTLMVAVLGGVELSETVITTVPAFIDLIVR